VKNAVLRFRTPLTFPIREGAPPPRYLSATATGISAQIDEQFPVWI